MKHYLLGLAVLLGATTAQAQLTSAGRTQGPFGLSPELRHKLALPEAETARPSTTVRKPGKATTYQRSLTGWNPEGAVTRYTYDNQGRVAQLVESDSATQRLTDRFSFTYNAAGSQTSSLEETWDGAAWQNSSRSLETFNSANLPTEHLAQVWRNGAWLNQYRVTIGYDARNHYLRYQSEEWRNDAWVIVGAGRGTVTYNAAGAVVEETEETLDTALNIYRPIIRRLYTYPSPTSLAYSARIIQFWQNGAYVNQQRTSNFTYDSRGIETSSESEMWENGAWVLRSRSTTTYEPNGSTRNLYEQRVGNAWVAASRYSHLYDDFGTELLSTSEDWSNGVWTISEAYRYLVRYNATNDLVAQVRQNYNTTTKAYESSLKHIYGEFQGITLGGKASASLSAQTQLYPNPTTDRVTLELAGASTQATVPVEVVNNLGQVVQRLVLPVRQGQSTLELSSLQAGVYTVQLHTANGLVVKKVVRQ